MTATKYLLIIGGILIGLCILLTAGIGLVFLVLEQAGEGGEGLTKFRSLLSFPWLSRTGEENEFTGQTSGWLFGIACVPVVFCLVSRQINRRISLRPRLKSALEWFARVNNKYVMPFHTYLSVLALVLAIVHLIFSSCPLNPLPEWGLIGAGILVATGLIIKLRIASKPFPKLIKRIYQFHASLVVSGVLVSLLLAGHVLMD
jgi:hypothetical protein